MLTRGLLEPSAMDLGVLSRRRRSHRAPQVHGGWTLLLTVPDDTADPGLASIGRARAEALAAHLEMTRGDEPRTVRIDVVGQPMYF